LRGDAERCCDETVMVSDTVKSRMAVEIQSDPALRIGIMLADRKRDH